MKIVVKSPNEGLEKAAKILYKNCNNQTVLFLSGGSTPRPLYEKLANEGKLKVGAIAMVDDRYSVHEQYSNEFMIRESGLVGYIEKSGGAFFPVLEYGLSLSKTAEKYDDTVHFLFDKFPKRIAILGIGNDGHIASLPADKNYESRMASRRKNYEFVSFVRSFPIEPKVPRISLNMNALSLMDLLIIIVFGEDKKEGMKKALSYFFKGEAARITILITDQKI